MTTTTKSTKAAPASKGASTEKTVSVPKSIYRLAKQLDRDPDALAREIMQAGIEALDDGLASQPLETFEPVSFIAQVVGYSHFREFTITGWIERMSPELRADCEKEAEDCGQTLQQIVRERCQRGADLKLLAQPDAEETLRRLREVEDYQNAHEGGAA